MCPVGPLGPKKAPAPPSPPPEWKPHTDPRFEVNRQGADAHPPPPSGWQTVMVARVFYVALCILLAAAVLLGHCAGSSAETKCTAPSEMRRP